jgi:hypothetical protein
MSDAWGDDAQRARQGLQARGRSRGAEPRAGADRLQRPLRSRFQRRLTGSVGCQGGEIMPMRKYEWR